MKPWQVQALCASIILSRRVNLACFAITSDDLTAALEAGTSLYNLAFAHFDNRNAGIDAVPQKPAKLKARKNTSKRTPRR